MSIREETDRSPASFLRAARAPATLALLLTALAGGLGWLQPIDRFAQDLRASVSRHQVASDLVIIEIDALSLRRLESWPWPRRYHARLLDRLRAAGVASIFYDVDFSSASNSADDSLLAQALSGFPRESVMLPAFVQPGNSRSGQTPVLALPLPEFRAHAVLASVNLRPDNDGLIRKISGSEQIGADRATLAGVRMSQRDDYERRTVPIDYAIHPGSFDRLSFADVLEGRFDRASLHGKHVVVGATAIELGDMLPVPVYQSLPGVVVQALAYQTLQQGGLRPVPHTFDIAATLLLFGLMIAVFRRVGWRGGLVFVSAGLLLTLGLALYAYHAWRVLATVAPQTSLLLSGYAFFLIARLEQQHLRLLIQAFDLRRKDALMAGVVDNSIDGILTVSERGVVTSANPAAQRLFHAGDEDLSGRHIGELFIDFPAPGQDGDLPGLLMNESGGTTERRARLLDGGDIPVEIAPSRMDLDGKVIYNVFIRDITERKRHRDALQRQATHDALTGLGNRYFLNHKLRQYLSGDAPGPTNVALLLIDLDKFKEINDALGHGVGDQLLKQVAQRFGGCIDEGMALARIGGDEFAILLRDAPDARQSRQTAERLLRSLEQPFPVNDIALEIGASIGIALYPGHGPDPVLLMQNADTAMYVAKRAGMGVSLYQPEFAQRNALRMAISTGLRQAIAEDRLCLYFQPKLDIARGTVTSAEALLRWNHPDLGNIGPEDIVEVAESAGLIWVLTEWTLRRALDGVRAWRAAGYPLRVAVNLSARLLQDQALAGKVTSCLAQGDFAPDWLTLEITESAIMADPAAALKNARALQAAGIHLSIDDFGTGYSSLKYLKDLPASELKIDKSFVMDMMNQDKNALIIKSTIELAHNLGLAVVAEGIESAEILAALRELGCDVAQGYYISRPLAFEKIQAWLAANDTRAWTAFSRVAKTGT